MRKKRILFCSEATFLNTGYATYTREILNYLYGTNKYEIAEFASYGHAGGDDRAKDIPWKFYGASVPPNAPEAQQREFASNPANQFGQYFFESVCLDFLPDIVCDIRDFWMLDFQERSPFRRFYKWCIMPTVDAAPQARQWVYTYANADACLTYSDWAGEVLKKQSGGKINYLGSAPPSAHPAYKPLGDKSEIKKYYGIDSSKKILGTVMRNQRRKLYPDLFKAFRIFLDSIEDNSNYLLYCHTSYPDMGWNIPELLQENNLSSKVLFTYVCPETNKPIPSFFNGASIVSPFTGKRNATLSNVRSGLSYENLSEIINMFDIYLQYANCEGFGLPQVEAAACAVPVMATDYSAMESVIRKLGGIPIKPKALYKEMETGCMRAVPDNELAASKLVEFFKMSDKEREDLGNLHRENFLKYFQWHISGSNWEKYFDSVEVDDLPPWFNEIQIRNPKSAQEIPTDKNPHEVSSWLINNVLCDPSKINSFFHMRLTQDLLYGFSANQTGGMYYNEDSAAFSLKNFEPFDYRNAYNGLIKLCMHHNHWEKQREIMVINEMGINK